MKNVIDWIKATGLRNIAYLGIGIGAKVLLGSDLVFGIGIGVFLADNWITIKNLIKVNILDK